MELARFSQWILDIGEGNIECTTKDGESEPSWIEIQDESLLKTSGDKVSRLVGELAFFQQKGNADESQNRKPANRNQMHRCNEHLNIL
jgi:hypothetical protein